MGTNYYWHPPACEHCGRSDDALHVCKSHISFHGVFDWDDDGKPVPVIVSWEQWKHHLRTTEGRIVDEYGHEYDVEAFITRVESTSPEARRWQYDWVIEHVSTSRDRPLAVAPGGTWLDPDGFSFYGGEFS
jgi:hypothetical protein